MTKYKLSCPQNQSGGCSPGELNKWATINKAFIGDGIEIDLPMLRNLKLIPLGKFKKSEAMSFISRNQAVLGLRTEHGPPRWVQVIGMKDSRVTIEDPNAITTDTHYDSIAEEIRVFMPLPKEPRFLSSRISK